MLIVDFCPKLGKAND